VNFDPIKHPRNPANGKFVERGGSISDAVDAIEDAIREGDLSSAEEAITENTSLESVSLSNLSPDQMPDAARELAGLDEQGALENVDSFNTSLPNDVDPDAIGHYSRETREVSIKGSVATEERLSTLEESGFLAGGYIEHIIRHEVGHSEHFQSIRDSEPDIPPQARLNDEISDQIENELGAYATENGAELVAEVFAVRAGGGDVSNEIMEIYNTVGGP